MPSDSFPYANGALVTVSGGAWVAPLLADFQVVSNRLRPAVNAGYWEAGVQFATNPAFPNQYAQVTTIINTSHASNQVALYLRYNFGTNSGYFVSAAPDYSAGSQGWEIVRITAGAPTVLASGGTTYGTGTRILQAEIIGSTIRVLVDGVLVGSAIDATYSAAGSAGIYCYTESSVSAVEIDNWNLGTPGLDATPGPSGPGVGHGGRFGPLGWQWRQQSGVDAAVVTGSPQTVNNQVADLVLTPIAGVVTAGNATVAAQVATLTLTPLAGTVTGGATTLTAQVATITFTPIAGTVVAGGVTITAQVATLTLTPIAGVVTPGNATVTAQVATLTLTPIAGTVTGGATTLTAQVATLTFTGIPGTPSTTGGAQSVTAQIATLTLTAIAGTTTGGAVSLTAQIATLTLTGIPGSPSTAGGPQSVTAQIATLTFTPIAGTVVAGGVTKTAQVATLALTAVPGTLSAVVTIQAQIATLTLLARAGTVTGGPVTIAAQRALLTLLAVPGAAFVGTIQPLIGPFAALIDGYQSSTADAVRSITRNTITTTSTVNSTPKTSTRNITPEGETG